MTKLLIAAAMLATILPADAMCWRMKPTDTLIIHGHRQHAERFVECVAGHWPNADSVIRRAR